MEEVMSFQKDLDNLLVKHNAKIEWNCSEGSDLHGVHDEKMMVINHSGKVLMEIEGNEISSYEISLL